MKETSERIASIAGRWLGMSDEDMRAHLVGFLQGPAGDVTVFAEIREMAASALAQREADLDLSRLSNDDLALFSQLLARARAGGAPWTGLKSSNLRRCRFDPVTAILTVEFLSGVVWDYKGVRADVAAQLAIAPSPGRFFIANVRDRFEGTRVSDGKGKA